MPQNQYSVTPKIFVEYGVSNSEIQRIEITSLLAEILPVLQFLKEQLPSLQNPVQEDPLITLSELAIKLRKSESTLHLWKAKGLIPYHRVSRSIFFKELEVIEALKKIPTKRNVKPTITKMSP